MNKTPMFDKLVHESKRRLGYKDPSAFAIGVADTDTRGNVTSVRYGHINVNESFGTSAIISYVIDTLCSTGAHNIDTDSYRIIMDNFREFMDDGKIHPNIETLKEMHGRAHPGLSKLIVAFINDEDDRPRSVEDVYLRLYLLSTGKVAVNHIDLSGIQEILPHGRIPLAFEHVSFSQLGCSSESQIYLGAQFAHRGRAKFDITPPRELLEYISIGRNTVVEYNAGTTISIGNNCKITHGVYLSPRKKVLYRGTKVEARELERESGILFRTRKGEGLIEAVLV